MNPEEQYGDYNAFVFSQPMARITPASQILSSIGVRPLYTNTGKLINPELYNTIGPMAPIGGGEKGLKLDTAYAYRTVGLDEIKSIQNEGVMITNPELAGQKSRSRAQTTKKMFSETNPSYPNAGYPENSTVLRVKKENVPVGKKGVPVNAADVEVMKFDGKQWTAKSVPEFLGESAKPSGPVKGAINKSAIAGKAGAAVGKGLMLAGAILELDNVPERIKGYYVKALTEDPTWRPDASDKFGMALFAGLETTANFATSGIYDITTKEEPAKTKGGYSGTGPMSERRSMPKMSEGEQSVHSVSDKKLPEIKGKVVSEDLQRYIKKNK